MYTKKYQIKYLTLKRNTKKYQIMPTCAAAAPTISNHRGFQAETSAALKWARWWNCKDQQFMFTF